MNRFRPARIAEPRTRGRQPAARFAVRVVVAAALAMAGHLTPARADGPAHLLRDINTRAPQVSIPDESDDVPSSYPRSFVEFGGVVYFAAEDDNYFGEAPNGTELWRTDGTTEGTYLVKDIYPGRYDSYPRAITRFRDALYFFAEDSKYGEALWRSEGTAATTNLVRTFGRSGRPYAATVVGDLLFLLVEDIPHGTSLWRSDGTESGTVLLKGISPKTGDTFEHFEAVGAVAAAAGLLFFSADDGEHGFELWRSDGSETGTFMVRDIAPGVLSSRPRHLTALGDIVLFSAHTPANGIELWRSDGTEEGTTLVADIWPGPLSSGAAHLEEVNGFVFFVANDGVDGFEIWQTDGTTDGTRLLADLTQGPEGSYFVSRRSSEPVEPEFTEANDFLFFRTFPSDRTGEFTIGRSDTTTSETTLFHTASGFPSHTHLTALGDLLLFTTIDPRFVSTPDEVGGPELWRTDGTAEGTFPIKTFHPPGENVPDDFTAVNDTLYFAADDGTGLELWKSDGTSEGTVQVKEINPGSTDSFYPRNPLPFADLDGLLLFTARDRERASKLWRSDGSESETHPIAGDYRASAPLTPFEGTLYFVGSEPNSGWELWQSGGTPETTELVADLNPGPEDSSIGWFSAAARKLFFVASTPPLGAELWSISGGVPTIVADIRPGPDGSSPEDAVGVGEELFFSADDGSHGRELWRSDGTAEGTLLVKDLRPGSERGLSPTESHLTQAGGIVYFVGDDGIHGREIWRSDGREAGTRLVADIVPGPDDRFGWPHPLASIDSILFFSATTPGLGTELWVSDGTEAGTNLVRDIYPGEEDARPSVVAVLGNALFFFADDSVHGKELWRSDGTDEGTWLVADLVPGPAGSRNFPTIGEQPGILVGGVFLFAAYDGDHGVELWRSDGTAEGTYRLQDVAPGPGSSSPLGFTLSGEHLFFAANDNRTGWELWAAPLDAVSCGVECAGADEPKSGRASGCQVAPRGDDTPWTAMLLALPAWLLRRKKRCTKPIWRAERIKVPRLVGVRLLSFFMAVLCGSASVCPAGASSLSCVAHPPSPTPTARPWQPIDLAHSTRGCAYVWDWKVQKLRIADWPRSRVRQASVAGIADDEWISDLAVSPDGSRAYLLLSKEIAVADLATAGVVARIGLSDKYSHGDGRIYLSPDGTVAVAVPDELPRASVVDLINGRLVGDLQVSIDEKCGLWNGVVEDVTFGSHGRTFYAVGYCGDPWVGYQYYFLTADAETARQVDTIRLSLPQRHVVVRDDHVAYSGWGDSITAVDLDTRSILAVIPTPEGHSNLAISVDGSLLLAPTGAWRDSAMSLLLIDTATNRQAGQVPIRPFERSDSGLIAIDPGGDEASFVDLLLPAGPAGERWKHRPIMWSHERPGNVAISERACTVPTDSEPIQLPTRTPTATPVPTVQIVVVSPPSGVPGETVTAEVILRWSEGNVAGIQVDLPTDGALQIRARTDGKPDCAANDAIGKNGTAFSFTWDRAPSYGYGRRARAFVLALDNVDPIADGSVLFSCQVAIGADTSPGRHTLPCSNAGASDPVGHALPAECREGEIVVVPREAEAVLDVPPPRADGQSGCAVTTAAPRPAEQWLLGLLLILLCRARRCPRRMRRGS